MRVAVVFLLIFVTSSAGMFIVCLTAGESVSEALLLTVLLTVSLGFGGTFSQEISTFQSTLLLIFIGTSMVGLIGMPCALVVAFLRYLWRTLLRCLARSRLEVEIKTATTRNRRWQFSISSLLVVTFLASVMLSLFAVKRESFRRQQAGLAQLQPFAPSVNWELRNVVELSFTRGTEEIHDSTLPLLSPFKKLRQLDLCGSGITDDGLGKLAELRMKNLESLYLSHTSVTSDGLAHLGRIPSLVDLVLAHTRVTDMELRQLLCLSRLRQLDLKGTDISDEGLRVLSEHPNLDKLTVSNTPITDAGLKHLRRLKLKEVSLGGTSVSDDGLRSFLCETTVEMLDLSETRITDRTLEIVASIDGLRILNVAGTDITDAGLGYLHGLKNLSFVSVENTKVSPSAVEELRRALPPRSRLYAPVRLGNLAETP